MLVLCQHYRFTGQRRESEQATQDLFHLKYGIRTLGDDKLHYLEVERKEGGREISTYCLSAENYSDILFVPPFLILLLCLSSLSVAVMSKKN